MYVEGVAGGMMHVEGVAGVIMRMRVLVHAHSRYECKRV